MTTCLFYPDRGRTSVRGARVFGAKHAFFGHFAFLAACFRLLKGIDSPYNLIPVSVLTAMAALRPGNSLVARFEGGNGPQRSRSKQKETSEGWGHVRGLAPAPTLFVLRTSRKKAASDRGARAAPSRSPGSPLPRPGWLTWTGGVSGCTTLRARPWGEGVVKPH